MADVHIAHAGSDQEPGQRQYGSGCDDRHKAFLDGIRHGIFLLFRLFKSLIPVHYNDGVVDGRAHLDGGNDHVRDKG